MRWLRFQSVSFVWLRSVFIFGIQSMKNKNKCCVCSPKYGSMTFWKNKDFWQSMLLYIGGGMFLALILMGFVKK